MRVLNYYLEGVVSAFTLTPDFDLPEDPDVQAIQRKTVAQAFAQDRAKLSLDGRKAMQIAYAGY